MNLVYESWSRLNSIMNIQLFYLDTIPITVASLVQLIAFSALLIYFAPKINGLIIKKLFAKTTIDKDLHVYTIRTTRFILLSLGFILILHAIGIDLWLFKQLNHIYVAIQSTIDLKLFKIGHTQLTLLTVCYLIVLSWLIVRFTDKFHAIVIERFLAKTRMDTGLQQAIGATIHYGMLFVGFIILLQTVGIDLSALTVLLGALGIGVSFGLQTIINNFISGIIILFERPIKIGDRVQIGDVVGRVEKISLRATTVITDTNIAIVVPNSQFITANVINWTYSGNNIGLKFPITISTNSDPKQIQNLILDAIAGNSGVLKDPTPAALLDELSNDIVKFTIHVWTSKFIASPDLLRSNLNFDISKKLKNTGIKANFSNEKAA